MTSSLYRFRPLNNYTIDELKNSYLYFATIDSLNDPMECFYKLFFKENKELYENLFKHFLAVIYLVDIESKLNGKETFKKDIATKIFELENETFKHLADKWIIDTNITDIIQEIENKEIWENKLKKYLMTIYNKFYHNNNNCEYRVIEYIKQLKKFVINELLVCCFYKPSSDLMRSCRLSNNEILMWAHYAGRHSGICMEFSDIKAQDAELQSKLRHKDISYENNQPKTLKFSIGLAASNNPNKLAFLSRRLELKGLQEIYNDKCESIYNTKLEAWKYENEHRYSILKKDLANQKLKYKIECLKSITFGVNTPQDEKDKIKAIINEKCKQSHRVNFYEVNIKKGMFEINSNNE